jgi:transcriptional regulator with PAS, ATPase and Fis domain
MFEDKLFGHEKGAFTGAVSWKPGCFETADGGTLFLDEVSELPFRNQVDFLRVLEDFTFTRIGGNRMIRVDVRLISATNKDLRALVKKGLFREDLFYRLQVVPLNLPPLRDRKGAIPKLVDHFLDRLRARYKKNKPEITREVMDILCQYHWPGNIRELKNLLERVFIVNNKDVIDLAVLPADFKWHLKEDSPMPDLAEIRRRAEKKAIIRVLRQTNGDKARSAKILNISPRTLRYKIQTLQIRPDSI